ARQQEARPVRESGVLAQGAGHGRTGGRQEDRAERALRGDGHEALHRPGWHREDRILAGEEKLLAQEWINQVLNSLSRPFPVERLLGARVQLQRVRLPSPRTAFNDVPALAASSPRSDASSSRRTRPFSFLHYSKSARQARRERLATRFGPVCRVRPEGRGGASHQAGEVREETDQERVSPVRRGLNGAGGS